MQIGMYGLGRMGANMVRRLLREGHQCVVYNRSPGPVDALVREGACGSKSLPEFVAQLRPPRVVWLMLPVAIVDSIIDELVPLLTPGDVIVDGGNTYFRWDLERAARLTPLGIHYVDCGVSGGIWGLERGYCLMIGGEKEVVARLDPIFRSLAPGAAGIAPTPGRPPNGTAHLGYLHCGPHGAGHFVKMVHNGIEYGLMAAYAEGFNILRRARVQPDERATDAETAPAVHSRSYRYDFPLADIAELWRRGSVIGSWLLDLAARALTRDEELSSFRGEVADSGEGRWTVQTAVEQGVAAHVLSAALFDRFASRGASDYAQRLLSALRFEFGGHREPGSAA